MKRRKRNSLNNWGNNEQSIKNSGGNKDKVRDEKKTLKTFRQHLALVETDNTILGTVVIGRLALYSYKIS